MSVLSVIIVDDEYLARVNLIKHLEVFENISVIGEADSCKTAIQVIEKQKPHLIFLDIQLLGESGFDILDKINSDIQTIFVTAYDEYAIRAFEVNAIDYLLKPINPERLALAISRIKKEAPPVSISKEKFNYEDSVYVNLNAKKSKFVKIKHIQFISSCGNYTRLHLVGGYSPIILKTMKQWLEELPLNSFIRIHHSTIININFVEKIEKIGYNRHYLILNNLKEPLPISRRYMVNLKNLFKP